MQEIKPLLNRRYIVRNARTKERLAIVEAVSTTQAIDRTLQLIEVTDLIGKNIDVEVKESDIPQPLPTFLDSYFDFLN